MDHALLAALSALGGALIGGGASVVTILIQARYQNRRELRRMAVDAGIEDHRLGYEIGKLHPGATLAPLSAYIHFHARYLDLLEEGDVTPEKVKGLRAEGRALFGD